MCYNYYFAQKTYLGHQFGHHFIFELCITQKEQGSFALLSLLTASLCHSDVDVMIFFFLYHVGEYIRRLCIGICEVAEIFLRSVVRSKNVYMRAAVIVGTCDSTRLSQSSRFSSGGRCCCRILSATSCLCCLRPCTYHSCHRHVRYCRPAPFAAEQRVMPIISISTQNRRCLIPSKFPAFVSPPIIWYVIC